MIEPASYQKKLEGKSNAHLIRFSDGKDYVVKYFQPGFEKSLPNEWVAYCLARYLGLPVPFAKIVEIPQEFSSQIHELNDVAMTQHQFASLYVPGCLNGHQVPIIPHIMNHKSLASIIVFDYWLCNRDRTRKNILLREELKNIYRLWAIDHAEVFGSFNWQKADLENLPQGLLSSATHKIMAKFIEDKADFQEQVELIQTIPILLMEEIVDLIPDDWDITREEKKAMVTALIKSRRKVLPKQIQRFLKEI